MSSPAVCPPYRPGSVCRLWIMQTAGFWYSPLSRELRNGPSHVPLGGTLGTWQSLGFIHYAWAVSPELVFAFGVGFFCFVFVFWSNVTIYLFLPPACSSHPLPCWLLSFAILMSWQRVPQSCSTAVATAVRLTATSQHSASERHVLHQ